MSRFKRAVPVLARLTAAPLFQRMQAENRAYPMAVKITEQLLCKVPSSQRKNVRNMIWRLTTSRRYLESCIAEGAERLNADGTTAGPVTAKQRAWAVERLARQAEEAKRLQDNRRAPPQEVSANA